ncbi:MAG: phosphatase PAP2 family protein [Anaerolineales bacterium]|nr:phosphatase PAP2 family protein [Anaerolineales bacterium]
MNAIIELGIAIILFLQGLGEWLAGPLKLITMTGNEEFYLFFAPAIYWCFDAAIGMRVGLALMVSGITNSILKLAMQGPRPYWVDSRVIPYSYETSFGVPSGHSQNAVVVWGRLAAELRVRWFWAAAIILMILIGFSRMYLGVHFPHDVLLGWAFGALVLWALLALEKPVLAWLNKRPLTEQILYTLAASLAMILVGALIRLALDGWTVPAEWVKLAEAAPGSKAIEPLALSGLVSNAGAFFGLALGGLMIKAQGGFYAGGAAWKRLARFLVGLAGVFLLWFGLGEIFPRGETLIPFILRYLRYGLLGVWITGLAPMLFFRLKLADHTK